MAIASVSHNMPRPNALRTCLVLLLLASEGSLASGQTAGVTAGIGTQSGASSSSSSQVDPYTVRGKVLNGLDGSGLPRALVTLGSRRVLTDPQGNFQFPGFTLVKSTMTAAKPGFSQTGDGAPLWRGFNSPDLTALVVLKLYPNPVITGIITGRDSLPVVAVQVALVSASFDVNGFRWVPAGSSLTNSRGEYRFNPPPGSYRVTVGFRANERDTGEVVLPVSFPEVSSTDKLNYFTVSSGQERRVDLRAKTGPGYPVLIKTNAANARGSRFSISATTPSGDSFNLGAEAADDGEYRINLPAGTYMVTGHIDSQEIGAGRLRARDGQFTSRRPRPAPARTPYFPADRGLPGPRKCSLDANLCIPDCRYLSSA